MKKVTFRYDLLIDLHHKFSHIDPLYRMQTQFLNPPPTPVQRYLLFNYLSRTASLEVASQRSLVTHYFVECVDNFTECG